MAILHRRTVRPSLYTWALAALAAGALVSLARRARAMSLHDKVVVVTGGSRGLGLLIAEEAGRQGARVAICGRDAAAAERAERWLASMGIEVLAEARDLGKAHDADAFIESVVQRFGKIDVLVNNAGVIQVGPLEQLDPAMIKHLMRSNFWSGVYMTFAALPFLLKQSPDARIVNVASVGGRAPIPHMLGYTASKFAQVGFSEGLRAELYAYGIRVTTVIPGPIRTGSFYNAEFVGRQRDEFAWFSVLSSLPIVSADARRSARRIVQAAREGRSEIRIGLSGRMMSLLHGAAPSVFQWCARVMAAFLPGPGVGQESWKGREINSTLPGSMLLELGDRAARQNNEEPPI